MECRIFLATLHEGERDVTKQLQIGNYFAKYSKKPPSDERISLKFRSYPLQFHQMIILPKILDGSKLFYIGTTHYVGREAKKLTVDVVSYNMAED